MAKHWEIVNKKKGDIIDILLENRGIKTKSEKQEFLNPLRPQEYKATNLGIKETQLNKAISRVNQAVKKKEDILVYGDYDADGICATAIVWEALHSLGAKATPFIPNRFSDGYGLNKDQVLKLKSQNDNLKLIITVDNGIVAFDAVNTANDLGIDVIITDHHSKKKEKPKAHAIVHTIQTSGSGVAWLFVKELNIKSYKNNLDDALGLAAIGTIADQLPLLGFNRSLAKHGLNILTNTQRIGLRKLFAVSGLLGKTIGTYEVNFLIAPRINASGRMADAMDALRLLCTPNIKRAEKLAQQLNNLNIERQITVDEALRTVGDSEIASENSVVFLSHESYHEGVIGLIASRVVEKYYLPAIVFSIKGEVAKASARSISGFSIIEAIRNSEEFIIEGGGHEMAAGFSILPENISEFQKRINEYSKPLLLGEVVERKMKIDTVLHFSEINKSLYKKILQLEPFGTGNQTPVFATQKAKIVSQRLVGNKANHLKLKLEENNTTLSGMMFNRDEEIVKYSVDVCYKLSENTWNGNTSIELMIKDFK